MKGSYAVVSIVAYIDLLKTSLKYECCVPHFTFRNRSFFLSGGGGGGSGICWGWGAWKNIALRREGVRRNIWHIGYKVGGGGGIKNFLLSFAVTTSVTMRFWHSECFHFPREVCPRSPYIIMHPKAVLPHQNAKKTHTIYQIERFVGKK